MNFLTGLFSGPIMFPAWGVAGSAVVLGGCAITALPYRGRAHEKYSPLNHYISELGELEVSLLARVFNVCLVVSGMFFAFFMVGFGMYYQTLAAGFAAAAGVCSSVACSAVGLFPMNTMSRHMTSAMSFFYGGLTTIILFGAASVMDGHRLLPPAFTVLGAAVTAAYVAFFLLPRLGGKVFSLDPSVSTRPKVWMLPLLEWLVMLGMNIWILAVSIFVAGGRM